MNCEAVKCTCEQSLGQRRVGNQSDAEFIACAQDAVLLWCSVQQAVLHLIAGQHHSLVLQAQNHS